jgi:hypothetical protein
MEGHYIIPAGLMGQLNALSLQGRHIEAVTLFNERCRLVVKKYYIEQQEQRCYYCRVPIVVNHAAVWDLEHIVSAAKYPRFSYDTRNLLVSCKTCNGKKLEKEVLVPGARGRAVLPVDSNDYLIPHPYLDVYGDHITAAANLIYRGHSPKGRYLIWMLNLPERAELQAEVPLGMSAEAATQNLIQAVSGVASGDPQQYAEGLRFISELLHGAQRRGAAARRHAR